MEADQWNDNKTDLYTPNPEIIQVKSSVCLENGSEYLSYELRLDNSEEEVQGIVGLDDILTINGNTTMLLDVWKNNTQQNNTQLTKHWQVPLDLLLATQKKSSRKCKINFIR